MNSISPAMYAFGAVAGVALVVAMIAKFRFSFWIVGLMTFIVSLGVAETYAGITRPTFLFLLQDNRSSLYLSIGVVLLLGLLGHAGKIHSRNVSIQAWFLLLMGLFQAFMRIY